MWLRLLSVGAGLWLMAAPAVLGYSGIWRTNDSIVGALSVSAGIIAMSEVMRPLRWINVALGAWLLLAPIFLQPGSVAMGHRLFAGLVILSAALVRGSLKTRVGGGWSALRRR